MKNSNQIGNDIINKRNKQKQEILEDRRALEENAQEQNPQLTQEEEQALDNEMEEALQAELLDDKPTVAPETMVTVLQKKIPNVGLVPKNERAARQEKRDSAAKAYASAQANTARFIPGYGDFQRDRPEQRACRFFNEQELASYVDHRQKTQKSYYEGQNMSEEEIANEIRLHDKEANRVIVGAVGRLVDEYSETFSREMTDEELIENYPDMVNAANFVNEAHTLLGRASKYHYEDHSAEQIDAYGKKVAEMMTNACAYGKRMAMLADPYYPSIRLEAMFEAAPSDLIKSSQDILADTMEEGVNLTDGPQVEEQTDMNEAFYGLKEKPANTMAMDENILKLPADISDTKLLQLENKIAANMGVSVADMKDNYLFCDKQGNTFTFDHSIGAKLDEKKELYVISKYGNTPALPVLLDTTKAAHTPLIGSEAIAAARLQPVPEPKKLGRLSRAWNKLSEIFRSGKKTQAKRNYDAAKARYDDYVTRQHLGEGDVPNPVRNKIHETWERNQAVDAKRKDAVKALENEKVIMQNGAPQKMVFDSTLANMIVHKAFTEEAGSSLRSKVMEMLRPFEEGYSEGDALGKLKKNDKFREFAWSLKTYNPELIEGIQSKDDAVFERSLKEIGEKFRVHFSGNDPMNKAIGEEYDKAKKVIAAEKKAKETVPEGQAFKKFSMEHMDKLYDNKLHWDSISAIYGPHRQLQSDWTSVNGREVYTIEQWKEMQKQDVDLKTINPGGKEMSERSFTALAMMTSIRNAMDFYKLKLDVPDTLTFEDTICVNDTPRDTFNQTISTVVEPSRQKLIECLKHMDEPIPGSDSKATGKEILAQDLKKALLIYAGRSQTFSWGKQDNSTMASVCDEVLAFAKEHNMMDMLMAQNEKDTGLRADDLEHIQIVSAKGKIVKDAFNAQTDLAHDCDNSKPLTAEQRLECLNKILLYKAVQADAQSVERDLKIPEPAPAPANETAAERQERERIYNLHFIDAANQKNADGTYADSAIARDMLKGGTFLQDLSERMMSTEDRKKLAAEGSLAILKKIRISTGDVNLDYKWSDYLKTHKAEEATRRLKLKQGKNPDAKPEVKKENAVKAGNVVRRNSVQKDAGSAQKQKNAPVK